MIKLSKSISKILRHTPHEIGLVLDPQGWVRIDLLLKACRKNGVQVTRKQLYLLAEGTDKQRFEIQNEKIRASHGHSVELSPGPAKTPPIFLYHGTPNRNIDRIFREGLQPQKRQFVHLSDSPEVAMTVAARHGGNLVLLRINARMMCQLGGEFYQSTNGIWLTVEVLGRCLDLHYLENEPLTIS